MKHRLIYAGRLFASALFCLLIFFAAQALLCPKYVEHAPEGALVGEYYANAGSNDVLFIGDCEVYENFSPVTLWSMYGIPSCIRGSAQQTIWQSYYLLEECFRYDRPKVVIFNVLSLKYDSPESTGRSSQREAYNRMTLDRMRPSLSKWKAVCASMTVTERNKESFLTYLCPILRYHDRWSSLTKEDFRYWLKKKPVSVNGYLMQTGVVPYGDAYAEAPPESYAFGENALFYLEKIRLLCEEKGARLVLIKAPSLSPIWWDEWESQVLDYARQNNLLYLNLLKQQEEIGLDWSTDTYDAGLHLNVFGAEKASARLGLILSEECDLPDRRGDAALSAEWQKKTEYYNQLKGSTSS